MNPHLQLQCGPMLRYDTVENGIYHAFALVVTADTGSDYRCVPRSCSAEQSETLHHAT